MRKFAICVLVSLALPLGSPSKDVPVKAIEAVKRSVVPVLCMQVLDNKEVRIKKVMGTGFFVNRKGHFLTAAHILFDWQAVNTNESPCFPAIYAPRAEWKLRGDKGIRWFKFVECQYSRDTDVAVCQTVENPFLDESVRKNIQPVSFASFVKYGDGSPVAFVGFPLDSSFPVTSKGYIASYIPSIKELVIDKTAWPGASGSPVIDPKGRVIGLIIKRGINEGIGLAYARPANFILDFLREKKIPVEK